MNYLKIKNNFEIVKYNYPDIFTVNIYYINEHECNINVKREDSGEGWGLSLEIIIYDINDRSLYQQIVFGSSDDNFINKKIGTTILLEKISLENNPIINYLPPRNYHLILNKYKILNNDIGYIDLHIVIYHLADNLCNIIIRRLDEDYGWDIDLKIELYDIDYKTKEFINIGSSKENLKIIEQKTKVLIHINPEKHDYKQNIPKIILQTGTNSNYKNIYHYNSILSFIELNPEYHYIYLNDSSARKFLRENFSKEINYAYDILIPGAFKADLLRYCLLYHFGGCYFDCKQILKVPIRNFLDPNKNLVLCNDVIENALLNAVIFSVPKNEILHKTIQDCVYNIINKIGNTALAISGPIFFYKSIKDYINHDNMILQNHRPPNDFHDFTQDYYNNNVRLINSNNKNQIILHRFYKSYYDNYIDKNHYGKLFEKNEVYYVNYQKIEKYIFMFYPNITNELFYIQLKDNQIIIRTKHILKKCITLSVINEDTYNEKIIHVDFLDKNFAVLEWGTNSSPTTPPC